MVTIITLIVAFILAMTSIVSKYVFIGIVVAAIAFEFIGAGLYFKFGYLKIYYHDLLGWHTPDDQPQHFDGCSQHARCKHCGEDIMQDSQGNWF